MSVYITFETAFEVPSTRRISLFGGNPRSWSYQALSQKIKYRGNMAARKGLRIEGTVYMKASKPSNISFQVSITLSKGICQSLADESEAATRLTFISEVCFALKTGEQRLTLGQSAGVESQGATARSPGCPCPTERAHRISKKRRIA